GFGAFGVVYAIVLIFCLRDAPDSAEEKRVGEAPVSSLAGVKTALGELFTQSGFWVLFGLNALVGVANWAINGWLPTYLKDHFKMGLGAAGMSATGYIQVASFAGVLIGGAWADHWSRSNARGRALVPALGYCLAGPCLFLAAGTDMLGAAIAGLVVFGLG